MLVVVLLNGCGAGTDSPSVVPDGEPVDAQARRGDFVLTMRADSDVVGELEPIEAAAELTYVGPNPSVEIWASGGGPIVFSVRQVDGSFLVGGASTSDCAPYTLESGEPLEVAFQKSGGFDPQDPGSVGIRNFLSDPLLRFPEGVWELTASANFLVGECALPAVDIQASVVIEVP